VGERPRYGVCRTHRATTIEAWDGLNLRRGSWARRADELGRGVASHKELNDADGAFGPDDSDVFGAELALVEKVADRAIGVRQTDGGRRHPIRDLVPAQESLAPIVAMHRRAAQGSYPVQGDEQGQGDWSASQ
jgi:hypothetical protein